MAVTWVPDAVRTFNLGLRSRTVDHTAKTVTLELASDEALLMDYAPLTLDTTPHTYEASLRAVCNYVIGKVIPGAVLAAGPDANVTAYWEVTNLMPNPALRSAVGNWIPGGANATLTRATGLSVPGLSGVSTGTLTTWTGASGTGQGGAYGQTASVVPYVPVTPYKKYTVTCYALSNVTKSVELKAQTFGADGAVLDPGRLLTTVTLTAGTWTRVTATITTKANVARLGPFLYAATGQQWAAGNTLTTTGWMVYEGYTLIPFFDGSTSDTSAYAYTWSGDVGASASTRTPVVERLPELFDWKPGVTAWAFLEPLTSLTGLRLFCDEKRVWRLINPATYTVAGTVNASGLNLTEGIDTLGRDDPEVFATGVVCRYAWTDSDGVARTAVDTAGTPGKVVIRDYARPYPGPGAAAAILTRRNGTGRTQDITGIADWAATPAQGVSVRLPTANEQRGRVDAVDWAVDDTGLMTIGTRELFEVYPGSIDALVGTIDALVGTIDAL